MIEPDPKLAEAQVHGRGESVVLVEPFGAGGGVDVIASALAAKLTQVWAVPVTVDDAISATIARLAAGEADYAMCPIPIAQPHLGDGSLIALGISGARRSQLLPRVPTLQEVGAVDFDFPIWYGIWAPSATPALRVEELNDGIGAALGAPELRSWLGEHGAEPLRMTRREFADFVIRERDRAAAIARAAGISPTR